MSNGYNIGSIPLDYLINKNKVSQNVYYDPNTVSNFMKDNIKYTGCDAPLFEEEIPSKDNINRQNRFNIMHNGSRYERDPYHPEMFMGDLTKDERGTTNEPIASKIVEQNKFRYEKYIKGKLQNDDTKILIEGIIPRKKMNKIARDGINYNMGKYSSLFDESDDTIHRAYSTDPIVRMQLYNSTLHEENKQLLESSEQIVTKFNHNPVSLLSNKIGLNWNVQPELKFKVSSISNLYRSKGDVDRSVNAIYRLAKQDTKYKQGNKNNINKSVIQLVDNIKKSKK
jgi:hypothetical protein